MAADDEWDQLHTQFSKSVRLISWMVVWAEHIVGKKSGKHNKQNDMVSLMRAVKHFRYTYPGYWILGK